MTNVVMCPSHLVEKWKREVERLVPNAKAYIINELEDLIRIENKITYKNKLEHTFLILSKETAKFSYELRPAAIWSKTKNAFICPCCGQPLKKKVQVVRGGRKVTTLIDFDKYDMKDKLAYNSFCENEIKVYDTKQGKFVTKKCHTSLWVPLNKEDKNTKWVKLGKEGWILKEHIDEIFNDFVSRETLTKKEEDFFIKVLEVKNALDNHEEIKGLKAPRKYSISKYIKKKFNNKIDYFIADELDYLAPHIVIYA